MLWYWPFFELAISICTPGVHVNLAAASRQLVRQQCCCGHFDAHHQLSMLLLNHPSQSLAQTTLQTLLLPLLLGPTSVSGCCCHRTRTAATAAVRFCPPLCSLRIRPASYCCCYSSPAT
jgi:hypothetical protein